MNNHSSNKTFEVSMEINLVRYTSEIVDFLSVETLEKIDYGILDLSKVKDYELKKVLNDLSELLEMELRYNYLENNTGLFRVSISKGKYYYCEIDVVLEADSLVELKEMVLSQNRIWYVFDEIQAKKLKGGFGN